MAVPVVPVSTTAAIASVAESPLTTEPRVQMPVAGS